MIKYINSTAIYAAWMVRKKTLSITNNTLGYINYEFAKKLKSKKDYHIFGLGEYDSEYFEKNSLGLVCKEGVTPAILMNLIAYVDMDTYLDISQTIKESEIKNDTILDL